MAEFVPLLEVLDSLPKRTRYLIFTHRPQGFIHLSKGARHLVTELKLRRVVRGLLGIQGEVPVLRIVAHTLTVLTSNLVLAERRLREVP